MRTCVPERVAVSSNGLNTRRAKTQKRRRESGAGGDLCGRRAVSPPRMGVGKGKSVGEMETCRDLLSLNRTLIVVEAKAEAEAEAERVMETVTETRRDEMRRIDKVRSERGPRHGILLCRRHVPPRARIVTCVGPNGFYPSRLNGEFMGLSATSTMQL